MLNQDAKIAKYEKRIQLLESKIAKYHYLKESLDDMFNQSPNSILILDVDDFTILEINDEAQKKYQRSVESIVGCHISVIHSKLIHEKLSKQLTELKRTLSNKIQSQKIESIVVNCENIERIVEITGFMIHYKGRKAIAALYNDITYEKSIERQIEVSKYRYELIVENIDDIISIHDIDGKFLYITSSITKITGWNATYWLGKNGLETCHPDDAHLLMEAMAKLLKGEKENYTHWRAQTIRGDYIWLESVSKLVYDNYFKQKVFLLSSRNITAQKLADNKIAENETKYRTLFNSSSDAIFILDSSVFIDCNTKTLEMFNCSRKEIIGREPHVFSPEFQSNGRNSYDFALEQIQKAIRDGANRFEWQHKKLTGEIFEAEISLNKFELNDRVFLHAIVRDISEKKEISRALVLSEKNYKNLVEQSPVPMVIHSNRIIQYANSATLKLAETDKIENIIGTDISNYIHPKSKELIEKRVKSIYSFNQKQDIAVESFYTLKGNEKTCEVAAIPFIYDGKPSSLVVFWDISKEVAAHETLLQSEMLLRNALDGVEDGIWEYDIDTKKLFLSVNSYKILGYDEDELGNELKDWKRLIRQNDFLKIKKDIKEKINSENKTFSYQIEITTKSGRKKWLLFRGKYFEFKTIDNKRKLIGLISDISYTKEQEKILARNKKELEYALKTKDDFLRLIAHDLKSPIAGFKSLTKILHDDLKTSDSEDMQEIALSLYNSSENILNLLENLLKWTKITKSSIKLDLIPINLFKAVNEIIDLLNQYSSNKNIEFNNNVNPEIVIKADKEILNTILRNILSNAIKFSKRNNEVLIIAKEKHDLIILNVVDTGIGMSAKKLSTVFQIESYESSLGTEGESGSGLGLIICKEFIEKMKGKIEIKSELDYGTQVKLTFRKNL